MSLALNSCESSPRFVDFAPKGAAFDSFDLMTGAQNQRQQRASARWRQWPSSPSECRCLELGASAPFNCFVMVECVKDPNVQECADAPNCKLCHSMRQSPAFRTLTKASIANSTKLSGTCIFTILPNSGFAIDLHR
jgi:hypothetical protein